MPSLSPASQSDPITRIVLRVHLHCVTLYNLVMCISASLQASPKHLGFRVKQLKLNLFHSAYQKKNRKRLRKYKFSMNVSFITMSILLSCLFHPSIWVLVISAQFLNHAPVSLWGTLSNISLHSVEATPEAVYRRSRHIRHYAGHPPPSTDSQIQFGQQPCWWWTYLLVIV